MNSRQSREYVAVRNCIIFSILAIVPSAIVANNAYSLENTWLAFTSLYIPSLLAIFTSALAVEYNPRSWVVTRISIWFFVFLIIGAIAALCGSSIGNTKLENGSTVYNTISITLSWSGYVSLMISYFVVSVINLLIYYRNN